MMRLHNHQLSDADVSGIDEVKTWINRVIEQRNSRAPQTGTEKPSDYWSFFADAFEYVRAMPSKQFKTLRLHTYHLDGATYQRMFFSSPDDWAASYKKLLKGLPPRYWLSAPAAAGEYGYEVDGRLVNDSVINWQEVIAALWERGILKELERAERPVIVEVGSGYGALAHHLLSVLPHAVYIAVDIPETLFLSASYMTLARGASSVRLVDSKQSLQEPLQPGTFVAVPNTSLSLLEDLKFDLACNFFSFQEMNGKQVKEYVQFLAPRARWLISCNQDRQDFNLEEVAVSSILAEYFNTEPLPNLQPQAPVSRRLQAAVWGLARAVVPQGSGVRYQIQKIAEAAQRAGLLRRAPGRPYRRVVAVPKAELRG